MKYSYLKKIKLLKIGLLGFLSLQILVQNAITVRAEIDYNAEAEARKSLSIQTNEIENWPQGPCIGAESAILMEATTGTILYAKNIDEQLYPASTTKILTCLIAAEQAEMNEVVTFSNDAVFSIERGSSNMGMDVGEQITMEQALYGVLVGSANESANAVAEHIAGTVDSFSKLMNQKAKELGCKNSNFVNPNGLYNDNHYTTAYDLATIARQFFSNDLLCKMSSTSTYEISPTPSQPDDIIIHSKNKLLPDREYTYDYLVGSKTGFTSEARQTLVSCAKKDGLTLICVIMKEESPNQFTDTVSLFDYGFSNFTKMTIADHESDYNVSSTDFFQVENNSFGNSSSILTIDEEAYVVLPNSVTFDDIQSELVYNEDSSDTVATIQYKYQNIPIGSADVTMSSPVEPVSEKPLPPSITQENEIVNNDNVLFINVTKILFIIIAISGILISIFVIHSLINNYNFSKSRKGRRKSKTYVSSKYEKYDF